MDLQHSTAQPDAATVRARVLAHALIFNGERYEQHEIEYAEWLQEQRRLWNLAAELRIASDVVRLCCPSLANGSAS